MRRLYILLAAALMAATLIAVANAGSAVARPQSWAALAYAPSIGQSWKGDGFTKWQAKKNAVKGCEQFASGLKAYREDCQAAGWVMNGWIALAYEKTLEGPPYHIQAGWGWGHTRDEAAKWAMKYCRENAKESCEMDDIGGSGEGYSKNPPAYRTKYFDATAASHGGAF